MKVVFVLVAFLFCSQAHSVDLRKDKESHKVAKKAAMYLQKEGKKMPKGASDKAREAMVDVCGKQYHKGCYFWEKGSKIMFQPIDSRGQKDGKIYEMKSWLKKVFK